MTTFIKTTLFAAITLAIAGQSLFAMQPQKKHRVDPVLQGLSSDAIWDLRNTLSHVQNIHRENNTPEHTPWDEQGLCPKIIGHIANFLPVKEIGSLNFLSKAHFGAASSTLQYLDLSSKSVAYINRVLFDQYNMPRFPTLKHLDLSHAAIDNATINKIMTHYDDELLSLRLNCCFLVTNLTLAGNNLIELDLSNCVNLTDAATNAIAASCPKLQKLNLNGCFLVTNLTLTENNITELDLSSCINLTNAAVNAIVASCPNLQKLNLNCCLLVTNLTFAGNNLIELDLSNCINLTDVAVNAIVANCPKLQTLSLWGCFQVTNLTLTGNNITELDLSCCYGLIDADVMATVASCPKLQTLSLRYCRQLTQACIETIRARGITVFTDVVLDHPPRADETPYLWI